MYGDLVLEFAVLDQDRKVCEEKWLGEPDPFLIASSPWKRENLFEEKVLTLPTSSLLGRI